MSIISQIGVVILIAFIVLVLIRSNKNLKKASEEGENFVDEWALRQEKKEEIKQKREEKKLEVQKEKEQKKLQKEQKRKGILVDEDNEPEEYELREEKEEKQALEEDSMPKNIQRRMISQRWNMKKNLSRTDMMERVFELTQIGYMTMKSRNESARRECSRKKAAQGRIIKTKVARSFR